MKRVCVAVTNDLSTDQRVRKICQTFEDEGWDITLVGRLLPDSKPVHRSYATKRFRLLFKKGALFYAAYNMRLFRYLLVRKFDLVYANDLDTLLGARMATRFKKANLVYDSHEYFTEVPELINRPRVQRIWKRIERSIFRKLKHVITVNKSIADIYTKEYGVDVQVMRNVPDKKQAVSSGSRQQLGLKEESKIIVLQGAWINVDRGGEELVEAMSFLDGWQLLVIGSGDAVPSMKSRVDISVAVVSL